MTGRLLVVGDLLLGRDVHGSVSRVMPDAPAPVLDDSSVVERPGGARLAALLAAAERPVRLLTAAAPDGPGGTAGGSVPSAWPTTCCSGPVPGCAAVVVTLGAGGALVSYGAGAPLVVPAPPVTGRDSCGAGDRFAAAMAGGPADGLLPGEAAVSAVASASALVAAGGAGALVIADRATGPAELSCRPAAPSTGLPTRPGERPAAGRRPRRWPGGSGPRAARWWRPAAASTWRTPAMSGR